MVHGDQDSIPQLSEDALLDACPRRCHDSNSDFVSVTRRKVLLSNLEQYFCSVAQKNPTIYGLTCTFGARTEMDQTGETKGQIRSIRFGGRKSLNSRTSGESWPKHVNHCLWRQFVEHPACSSPRCQVCRSWWSSHVSRTFDINPPQIWVDKIR